MATTILIVSTALQYAAAFIALRLIKLTGQRTAWISIATATLLMALRRTITLASIIAGDSTAVADPAAESVALIISVLMVVGVSRIAPVFLELQKSTTEIQRSQRQLQDILDHFPAAVYVKDREGKYLLVNKYVAKTFEISKVDRLPYTDYDLLPHDVAEMARRNDAQVIAKRKPIEFQETLTGSDGTRRHYLSIKFPLFDSTGEVYAICGISSDVTERLRLDQERREFESQLQEAQRLESLGVLAGGIAHDFNNLLAAILGRIDLALSHDDVNAAVREDLDHAVSASQAAAALCNQLLVYAGKGKPQMVPVNLSELVANMSRLMEVSSSQKAKFERNLASDLPAIEADPSQVQQVVMNLVTNATEALTNASGSVTISTSHVTIDDKTSPVLHAGERLPAGSYLCLEVRDTGEGMDEETRRRLFEPFYTTKFTGRGLGLAAVAGIMKSHRGGLGVESSLGAGAVFRAYFPVSLAAPNPVSEESRARMEHNADAAILVVDDEPMIRNLVTKILERSGYAVQTAENGKQAVELFSANPDSFSLILMDVLMPVMDGHQALAEMQRIDPAAKILLSSGFDEESMNASLSADSATGFIQKPYRAMELLEAVRNALG